MTVQRVRTAAAIAGAIGATAATATSATATSTTTATIVHGTGTETGKKARPGTVRVIPRPTDRRRNGGCSRWSIQTWGRRVWAGTESTETWKTEGQLARRARARGKRDAQPLHKQPVSRNHEWAALEVRATTATSKGSPTHGIDAQRAPPHSAADDWVRHVAGAAATAASGEQQVAEGER